MHITGKVHLHFETITSTNDIASYLLSKTAPIDGTAISADFQSAGRGQFGRTWEGHMSQNVAVSIIYQPNFINILDQFYLNKAIALAVFSTVSTFVSSADVKIKWPNDIYVNDAKIAGILIQNTLQGNKIKYAIIGIGINVFQKDWTHLSSKATAISNYNDSLASTEQVLQCLFYHLDIQYIKLMQKAFSTISEQYNALLFKKDEFITFTIENNTQSGVIQSVDNLGRLQIKTDLGTQFFEHGTIKFII
ncbi:MAG TPA: biotin--[acetyl-CoA-carboxylase] ligase [Saprospiraceae bacterium]|nr:biotin--[acetyl-CoA-carboxylase] ligase [Saprospiraceae bacterium]